MCHNINSRSVHDLFIYLQIFLDPLRKAFNQKAVDGLISHCKSHKERIFLQSLGLSIGIKSWIEDFKNMIKNSSQTVHDLKNSATGVKGTNGTRIVSSVF